jgi:hypothetical protein
MIALSFLFASLLLLVLPPCHEWPKRLAVPAVPSVLQTF